MVSDGMHFLYGETSDSSCVPDVGCRVPARVALSCAAQAGPVFDMDGAMVLGESFRADDATPLDALMGQYLADAFVLWECWDDCEEKASPLLLRFEEFDVVCSAGEDSLLALWSGALDVSAPVKAVRDERDDAGQNARTCYAWERPVDLSALTGCLLDRIARTAAGALVLEFDDGRLCLEPRGAVIARSVDGCAPSCAAVSSDSLLML